MTDHRIKNIIFFISTSSFLFGILLCALIPAKIFWILFVFIFIIAILCVLFYEYEYRKNKIIFAGFLIIFFSLGAIRFLGSAESLKEKNFDFLSNQNVTLKGLVINDPEDRGDKLMLKIRANTFALPTKEEINAKDIGILIWVKRFTDIKYGDEALFRGKIQIPKPFQTDSQNEFDYPNYLKKEKIIYTMFYPSVQKTGENGGNIFKKFLIATKKIFTKSASRVIDEPMASLSNGIIWGEKRGLPENVLDDFRVAGLMHIIVLSGYNLTVVADGVIKYLSFLRKRKLRLIFASLFILLYALASGGSPAAIRACIMAIIVIFAKFVGRPYDMARALFLAGFLMALNNPFIVPYDPGFALSFLATLSLILISPIITKKINFLNNYSSLKEIVSATIATQIFVMPLLFYWSGNFPTFSIISNIFVLPFIPFAMFISFISSTIGIISETLAMPLAFFANTILLYFIKVAEFIGNIPFGRVEIKNFPALGILFIYIFIFLFIFFYRKKHPQDFSS